MYEMYRVFIKYSFFCCSACVLPAWYVYTHWHLGKIQKGQSPKYFKIFGKNTIFNEHPVVPLIHVSAMKDLVRMLVKRVQNKMADALVTDKLLFFHYNSAKLG